jgi:hypothetical protein
MIPLFWGALLQGIQSIAASGAAKGLGGVLGMMGKGGGQEQMGALPTGQPGEVPGQPQLGGGGSQQQQIAALAPLVQAVLDPARTQAPSVPVSGAAPQLNLPTGATTAAMSSIPIDQAQPLPSAVAGQALAPQAAAIPNLPAVSSAPLGVGGAGAAAQRPVLGAPVDLGPTIDTTAAAADQFPGVTAPSTDVSAGGPAPPINELVRGIGGPQVGAWEKATGGEKALLVLDAIAKGGSGRTPIVLEHLAGGGGGSKRNAGETVAFMQGLNNFARTARYRIQSVPEEARESVRQGLMDEAAVTWNFDPKGELGKYVNKRMTSGQPIERLYNENPAVEGKGLTQLDTASSELNSAILQQDGGRIITALDDPKLNERYWQEESDRLKRSGAASDFREALNELSASEDFVAKHGNLGDMTADGVEALRRDMSINDWNQDVVDTAQENDEFAASLGLATPKVAEKERLAKVSANPIQLVKFDKEGQPIASTLVTVDKDDRERIDKLSQQGFGPAPRVQGSREEVGLGTRVMGEIETDLKAVGDARDRLIAIKDRWRPEFNRATGKLKAGVTNFQDYFKGILPVGDVDPADREFAVAFEQSKAETAENFTRNAKDMSGVAINPEELQRMQKFLPNENDSPIAFSAKVERAIASNDFMIARYTLWANLGEKGQATKPWMLTRADVGTAIRDSWQDAKGLVMDSNPGISELEAARQAADMTERSFGISPGGMKMMIQSLSNPDHFASR